MSGSGDLKGKLLRWLTAERMIFSIFMENLHRVLALVAQKLPAAGIDCLLIGGFAVNHYGYTRNTLDVDFMIVSERVDDVRRIMCDAGFTNIEIRDNVAFFAIPNEAPRVDFLRVDASTMEKLLFSAVRVVVQGHELRLPSILDLISMKIFAFSQDTARRMGKDLPDIAYLSVIHNLDIESDILPLCERFGTPETYRLIRNQIEGLRT